MKKVMMVAVATLMTLNVWASHLLGGGMGVYQTNYDSTSVAVYLIADPQGFIPQSISVEKWEMHSQGWYIKTGYVTLSQGAAPMTFQGHTLVNYVSDYLDLDSNKYRFIYKNCCWGNINNSSNAMQSEFVISADYWHIPNNSTPYALNPFWINMQINTPQTMKPIWGNFNCFLKEEDGDSVSFYQSDLLMGYANGTFVPQTHSPINMIANNDSIAFVSSTLGPVATGFTIEDWRGGQLIGIQRMQWTFKVVGSTVGLNELVKPGWNKIYDWSGNLIYEGNRVPWRKLSGFYIHITSEGVEKIWVD